MQVNVPELQEKLQASEERESTLNERVTSMQADLQQATSKVQATQTEKTQLLKKVTELELKTKDLLEQQRIMLDVSHATKDLYVLEPCLSRLVKYWSPVQENNLLVVGRTK